MKAVARYFAWNTGLALILNLTLRSVGTLAFIAIGRFGATSDAGVFTLGIGYLAILTTLFTSLDDILVRECARVVTPVWPLVFTYGCVRFALSILAWAILLLILSLFSLYSHDDFVVMAVVASSIIFDAFSGIAQATLSAYNRFGWSLIAVAIGALIKLIGVGVALINHFPLSVLVVVWPFGSIVSAILLVNILLIYLTKRGEIFKWALNPDWLKQLAHSLPTFTLMSLLSGLEYQMDVIFISILLSKHDVAVYSAGNTVMTMFLIISQAYRAVVYPQMAYLLKHQPQLVKRLVIQSFLMMGGIALLAVLIVEPNVFSIISALYGEHFLEAGFVLQVLIWNVVLFFLNVPLVRFMLANNKQSVVWKTVLISLTINIMANLWAIPSFGILGAAYVRLLSSSVFCAIIAWQAFFCLHQLESTVFLTVLSTNRSENLSTNHGENAWDRDTGYE